MKVINLSYGRSQTEEEARKIDEKISALLDKIGESYYTFSGDNEIASKVIEIL